MIKFKKQSLIDWQATLNGKSFAWITKQSSKNFSVKFYGYETQYGFATLDIAKRYIKEFTFA